MGQANERKKRIDAIHQFNVGPAGDLRDASAAVVLLSRTDPGSLTRLAGAARDLVDYPRLPKMLASLDRSSLDQADWLLVMHVPGGGTMLKLVAKRDDALTWAIDLIGEGLVARRLRWNTLVFGTAQDMANVRAGMARFVEDQAEVDDAVSDPKIAITQEQEPRLLIEISRADVDAFNLAPALLALDTFIADDRMLERMTGGVELCFAGYDDDQRFLGEVPEVDLYLRHLLLFAPWTPLVTAPSGYMLWLKPLNPACRIETYGQETRVHVPPGISNAIMDTMAYSLAEMTAERLMVPMVPPRMRRAFEDWQTYLAGMNPDTMRREAAVEDQLREQAATTAPARNEKEFWQSVTASFAPGWIVADLATNPDGAPAHSMSDAAAIIYVLDTKTGWMAAGGLTLGEMESTLAAARSSDLLSGAPSVAIQTIRDQADQRAATDSPQTRLCITATIAAFASTQTLQKVVDATGSLAGHYLYMVYSPRNADPIGRPIFLNLESGAVAPLETVYLAAADAIRQDLDNPTGTVGSYLRAQGGLALCEVLQGLVDDPQ